MGTQAAQKDPKVPQIRAKETSKSLVSGTLLNGVPDTRVLDANSDNNINNSNHENESGEPYLMLPSRGSTGQPRSCQQYFAKETFKKTCGDQNQPTQPPRVRNTNRGLRNPNTIEIRREKRSNKRRVARRQNRMQGGEDTPTSTEGIPQAKAQEPLKLKMKQML